MKTLGDALNMRNRLLQTIEKASVLPDTKERKRLLTVVVAGTPAGYAPPPGPKPVVRPAPQPPSTLPGTTVPKPGNPGLAAKPNKPLPGAVTGPAPSKTLPVKPQP